MITCQLGPTCREARAHLGRHQERRRLRPAERALGGGGLLGAERLAVRVLGVLLLRRAVADVAVAHHQARVRLVVQRALERERERGGIIGIRLQHLPAVGLESLHRVIGERDAGVAVDGDVIVVVHHHQVPEPEVARERRRLVRDALHHAAVAGDGEHAVGRGREAIAREARVGESRGQRHADGVADALPERSGGGLDAGGEAVFRMPRRAAAELPEALQLFHGQVVAREMQQRVEQHRAVPGREHETITPGPSGIARIVAHESRPHHVTRVGHAHGQARVAGTGLLDGIHREESHGVDGA